MSSQKFLYNTNLAKGTGFINETLTLIEFYEDGETKQEFLSRCISVNILDKSTEHRTKDIINLVFFDRFWRADSNVIPFLKDMRANGMSLDAFKSLILVYVARANQVLYDFLVELSMSSRTEKVNTDVARGFVLNAISEEKAPAWSDSMIKRVSSYLISCLKDFDLLDDDGFLDLGFPSQTVINYLLHELHFEGKRDDDIVRDNTWKLFGLNDYEVVKEVEKISFRGTFIFQYSGEILKIGWNYENMQEFIKHECG